MSAPAVAPRKTWGKAPGKSPAPAEPAASAAGDVWVEKVDAASGRTYYYNKATRQTSWKKPEGATIVAASTASPSPAAPSKATPSPPQQATPSIVPTEEPATNTAEPASVSLPTEEVPVDAASSEGSAERTDEQPAEAQQREPTPQADPVEELVQRIIAAAGLPLAHRNPMLGVSVDVLLRMMGQDSLSTTPHAGASAQTFRGNAQHPATTSLMVMRRVNEEHRTKLLVLRDAFEDLMKERAELHQQRLAKLKTVHEDRIAAKYAEHEAQRAKELAEKHTSGGDASEAEIAALEQRLFVGDSAMAAGGTADASARRLLKFWKSKFQTLCTKLEVEEESMTRLRSELAYFEQLEHLDASGLTRTIVTLREREAAARQRCDSLRQQYEAECTKRGLNVKEPQIVTSVEFAKLQNRFNAQQVQAVMNMSQEATTENASTAVPQEFAEHFFTDIGFCDSKVRAAMAKYAARREDAEDMALTLTQLDADALSVKNAVENQLNDFCEVAGSVTAATASFFEEIIQLRSQLEAAEDTRHLAAVAAADEEVRHATELCSLYHRCEELQCKCRQAEETGRRALREKDIDLFRVGGRMSHGHSVNFTDFSDAPTSDVRLHLDVLRSKLAVRDAERQLLKHRIDRANMSVRSAAAAAELDRRKARK